MELSLIGSFPAKFSRTESVVGCSRRDFCQFGSNVRDNSNLMMICSSITKSKIGFGQMIRCPNLPIRVSAQSVSHSQSDASRKASEENTTSNPKDGLKLYVGLPMNTVSDCNAINHSKAISAGLKALKLLGIEGVELPIYWGVAEKEAMGKYEWSGYLNLVQMIQKMGLKLHVSICFHASKEPSIPLPKWVSEIGESKPDIFFADRSGKRYKDCLSFSVDDRPVFDGKTAIEVYKGFIESFKTNFSPFMGSTITGISIGMGPDGELRYPSHQDHNTNTTTLGAGEFQCYDQNMMTHLKKHAENVNNPLWGLSGPHDAPTYHQHPILDTFFKENGSWETPYGNFFLSWYSTQLTSHLDRILSLATSSFSDTPVILSAKLPLIHSWHKTQSRPGELTAGFYNGYEEIAKIFSKNSCRIILPGMDLLDENEPNESFSSPELLLSKIRESCRNNNVEVCGQNVSVLGNSKSFEQIKKNVVGVNGMNLFLYQRMSADFFSPVNFPLFTSFVRSLNQLELGLDDLGVNGREEGVFLTSKDRKLQVV